MYDIAAGMARMEEGQKAICENIEAIQHRLFGNGQPGELMDIKNRISTLEKFRYVLIGVALVFSAVGGISGAIIEAMTRSK